MIVQACPNCSRQYDVSHIDPGGHVHCQCEERFAVRIDAPLRVQALSCSYCGGAVTVEDESCGYCNAKLDESSRRETTLCPMCYTRLRDDSRHCRSCGTEVRPQALTVIPAGRECPRCKGELVVRSLEHADVIECGKCGGIWAKPEVFERVCADATRRPRPTLDPRRVDQRKVAQLERNVSYIPCLSCGELMMRRQFRHGGRNSGVVVDLCREHGVWLDNEELEKIVEFVQRDATGSVPSLYGVPGDGLRPAGVKAKTRGTGETRMRGSGRSGRAIHDPGSSLLEIALGVLGDLLS